MVEYKMLMLKRASRLGLQPADSDAHIIAWANGLDLTAMLSGPAGPYLELRQQFVQDTAPRRYRLSDDPDDMGRLLVQPCVCECLCLDCGLLMECGDCQCDTAKLGSIVRELTARQLVDCGDDAIRLVEVAMGQSSNDMDVRDFRTVQFAVFRQLGLGRLPLSDG